MRRVQRIAPFRAGSAPGGTGCCAGCTAGPGFPVLLPLDRGRGLRADVVDDPVHARDLVHDPRRDLAEDVVGELRPVGRHPVLGGHRPDRDDVRVGPPVAHDADAPDRGQDRERLPDASVEAGRLDLVDDDPVRVAEGVQPLGGDLADDPDGEAGAGERLALDHRLGQAQLRANQPDLVLEQVPERLDQLEPEIRRQAADVVVGLDLLGGLRLGRRALDDVRVERALGQEVDPAELRGLLLEDPDELVADDLALLLSGSVTPASRARNRSRASTITSRIPRCCSKVARRSSDSFLRIRP